MKLGNPPSLNTQSNPTFSSCLGCLSRSRWITKGLQIDQSWSSQPNCTYMHVAVYRLYMVTVSDRNAQICWQTSECQRSNSNGSILRQVASARAVITDLLSSSTERTLAMSCIQILWSNQISANTWRLTQILFHDVSCHHYTKIFHCFSSSICMT